MIRYHLTALTLKSFSCCGPARSLYRGLGNWMGGKQRRDGPMPAIYFHRAQRNVAYCQRYRPIQPSDKVVELGTGWVHWEALTLSLFSGFEAVLYNVWDNRRLGARKSWVRQLEGKFGEKGFLEGCDFDRARAIGGKFNYAVDCREGLKLEVWLGAYEIFELLTRCPEGSIEIFWKASALPLGETASKGDAVPSHGSSH